MTNHSLRPYLEFAMEAAWQAGRATLAHFGTNIAVEWKGDDSPVTVADREAETILRRLIEGRYPDHAIVGEEFGADDRRDAPFRWIVDPIDGTRSFASGVPLYGVLIAMEEDGAPRLGCCHLPETGQTVVAATGAGAWLNGQRTRVSEVEELAEARVVTSGLEYWRDWANPDGMEGWNRLVGRTRFARTWGDCYGYIMVATGRAEILADPAAGSYWDYAPMVPILTEAGGRFTTLGGTPPRSWGSALATNGRLHAPAMACWQARKRGDEAVLIPEIRERQRNG